MAWQIEVTETAAKQLGKLDRAEAKKITLFLQQRLASLDDPAASAEPYTAHTSQPSGATAWETTESFAISAIK